MQKHCWFLWLMRKSTAPDQQCDFWQAKNLPPPKQLQISSTFRNRACGFESSLTAVCGSLVYSTARMLGQWFYCAKTGDGCCSQMRSEMALEIIWCDLENLWIPNWYTCLSPGKDWGWRQNFLAVYLRWVYWIVWNYFHTERLSLSFRITDPSPGAWEEVAHHRITEWLTLECTSAGRLVQAPCSSRVTWSQLPRAMSWQLLNINK